MGVYEEGMKLIGKEGVKLIFGGFLLLEKIMEILFMSIFSVSLIFSFSFLIPPTSTFLVPPTSSMINLTLFFWFYIFG